MADGMRFSPGRRAESEEQRQARKNMARIAQLWLDKKKRLEIVDEYIGKVELQERQMVRQGSRWLGPIRERLQIYRETQKQLRREVEREGPSRFRKEADEERTPEPRWARPPGEEREPERRWARPPDGKPARPLESVQPRKSRKGRKERPPENRREKELENRREEPAGRAEDEPSAPSSDRWKVRPAEKKPAKSDRKKMAGRPAIILDLIPWTDEKDKLTERYCEMHYGKSVCRLEKPEAVVIHFTAGSSFEGAKNLFRPIRVGSGRPDLVAGRVNVSAHFLVDRNGDIHQLVPLNRICRHATGYSYCSFGIEMVGRNASEITGAQEEAVAKLVAWLKSEYPSIRFVFGHHEAADMKSAHYKELYIEKGNPYGSGHTDPGPRVMAGIRRRLDEMEKLASLK